MENEETDRKGCKEESLNLEKDGINMNTRIQIELIYELSIMDKYTQTEIMGGYKTS